MSDVVSACLVVSSGRRWAVRWAVHASVVCVAAAVCGCSGRASAPTSNIATITGYYLQYAGEHANASPPDAEAFRSYVANQGVGDLDAVFVSSRDGKPYAVRYGINLAGSPEMASLPPSDQPKIVILHEADGVGGMRMTATHAGLTFETADPSTVQ
jgi:hypothetical protein